MVFVSRIGGCWLMLNAAVQSKAGNHAVSVEVLVDVATQRPLQHDQWDQEASTHPPVLVGFLADSEVDSVAGAEEASVEGSVIEEDLAAAQGQVSVIRVAATDSAVKLRQMRLPVQEVAATIGEAMGVGLIVTLEGEQAVIQSR